MTPHPHHPSSRVHVPHRIVRRSAAFVAAVLVLGATPLVARAIGAESATSTVVASEPHLAQRPAPAASIPDLGSRLVDVPVVVPVEVPAVDPIVDPVIAVLADTYTWDERGPRVAELQEVLGVTADGWYGNATQRAHLSALEFVGMPTDTVPVPVLPPGPDPSEWAALRDCESNGNYAITSRSGTYRGAYQFDRSTWNSVAERHAPHLVGVDPAAAAPADQDAMALALYTERGSRPWPHCGRHLT